MAKYGFGLTSWGFLSPDLDLNIAAIFQFQPPPFLGEAPRPIAGGIASNLTHQLPTTLNVGLATHPGRGGWG